MEMNRRLFGFELCDKSGRKRHLNMFVWRHYSVLTQHWNNTGGCLRRTIPDPEKQRIAPQTKTTCTALLKVWMMRMMGRTQSGRPGMWSELD